MTTVYEELKRRVAEIKANPRQAASLIDSLCECLGRSFGEERLDECHTCGQLWVSHLLSDGLCPTCCDASAVCHKCSGSGESAMWNSPSVCGVCHGTGELTT